MTTKTFASHAAHKIFLVAGLVAVPLLIVPGALAGSGKLNRSLPGLEFTHPAAWPVEMFNGNVRLRPSGASTTDFYVIAIQDLPESVSLDSPLVTARVDLEMHQYFPALLRQGGPAPFKTGCGPARVFSFSGQGNDGASYGGNLFVTFINDRVAMLLAIAPSERLAAQLRSLYTLFGSVTPSSEAAVAQTDGGNAQSPLLQQWTTRLRGRKLLYLSSYSSGGGGGSSTQKEIRLFADGRFTYNYSSSTAIYVAGGNGGSNHESAGKGTWRILLQNGNPVLEVTENGRPGQINLAYRDSKLYLNGTRYFVETL